MQTTLLVGRPLHRCVTTHVSAPRSCPSSSTRRARHARQGTIEIFARQPEQWIGSGRKRSPRSLNTFGPSVLTAERRPLEDTEDLVKYHLARNRQATESHRGR